MLEFRAAMRAGFITAALLISAPIHAFAKEDAMLLLDHPLVDTVWHMGRAEQVDVEQLRADVEKADHLLLGEKHDNPLHHEKQAFMVSMVREAEKSGQLVFEMADSGHKEILAAVTPDVIDKLGRAINWEERGWPDWESYQPIAEEALAASMRFKPGNPERSLMMQIGRGGDVPNEALADLRWEVRYSQAQKDDLLDELYYSHCEMMERDKLSGLVTMQRLKDAFIGRAMRQDRLEGETSILIAGNGHTRKDRGVPMFLDDGENILSVALIEVVRDEHDATTYPSFDPALYDYVWFTPRLDETDPCDRFREQLEDMKSKMGAGHGKK